MKLMVSLVSVALALPGPAAVSRLDQASALSCDFREGTSAHWDAGELTIGRGDFGANGAVRYHHIDWRAGTAEFTTAAGGGFVSAGRDATGLHFIERPDAGVSVVTIFRTQDGAGRHYAVISRHVDFLGPMPSQYYGTCTVD
jgi:hypothetical protein